MVQDQGQRAPDGRRSGPEPLSAPSDEDRQNIARLQDQAAERRRAEATALAEAAEPAGEPPSDAQRQAIVRIQDRSSDARAAAARALRRPPTPIGQVYDDEREQVARLHQEQRERRLAELADRGIVDPVAEAATAGFPPDLPHLPASELFGVFQCQKCGGNVERAFPGYVDWDLASRDLTCPSCGALVKRGGAEQAAPGEPGPEAERIAETAQTSAQAQGPSGAQPGQVTEALGSGQPGTAAPPPPPPLSADERAELEQLRAERAARQQAAAETPPAEPSPPAESPPLESAPPENQPPPPVSDQDQPPPV